MTSRLIRLMGLSALSVAGVLALSGSAVANTLPMHDSPDVSQQRLETVFETPTSVMTDEVGSITGTLRLGTEMTGKNTAAIRIQYDKADEWYTVTGGAFTVSDRSCEKTLHTAAVTWLSQGNTDVKGLSVDCAKQQHPGPAEWPAAPAGIEFAHRTDHVVPTKGVQIADGNILRSCVNIGTAIDQQQRIAEVYVQFCTQNNWYELPVGIFEFTESAITDPFHQAVVDWLTGHDRLDDLVVPGFSHQDPN